TGDSSPVAADLSTMEVLLKELLEKVTPATTHSIPMLTRTGFQRQVEFNCSLLNELELAKRDPSRIDSILETIKERNQLLTMADKNPQVLELADKAKTLEALSIGSSSGGSALMQLMMLQSLNQTTDRKRRAASPPSHQPFRQRASAYVPAGAHPYYRPPSLLSSNYGFSGAGGSRGSNGAPPSQGACHNCGQWGHFKGSCPFPPNNRSSARREAAFVSGEVERLLRTKAIEKATSPRVISPLSVVPGDPASLLSRAILHSIAEAQKSFLPPSTRIPLSPSEKGKKGTLVRDLSSTVSRVEPTLLPILLHSISGAKAASTIRAYKGSMANLRDYAMERGLDPSCPTSLVIYSLKKIQEGRALSTLKILSAAFSHYSDLPSPILAHILSHLHDSTRRKFSVSHHPSIPRSNIDSFVQYASLHPCDLLSTRTALGASLSFSALLRVSELLSLRWADLQWSSDFLKISVRRAKNDQFAEGRDTFISIEKDSLTLSLFHSYRERVVPSPWLFPSHSHPDRPLTSDTFRKDLTLLCSLAGVARITPHQLRAGGAMESISHGVPIEAVQRRGRWNSIGGIAPYIKDTVESQGGALPL
ncbi:hypothetical protein PENTCL1PPCAC_25747, partial [Pristionchus entomophagus]